MKRLRRNLVLIGIVLTSMSGTFGVIQGFYEHDPMLFLLGGINLVLSIILAKRG